MNRPAPSTLAERSRDATVAGAIAALADDHLIVLPTETVYGLAASAASPTASKLLAQITRRTGPASWHAPSRELALSIIAPAHPIHRRLFSLLPGPITFILELSESRLEEVRSQTRALPGTIDDGRELCLRVPQHEGCRALLAAAWDQGIPVIADSLAAARWAAEGASTGNGSRVEGFPSSGEPTYVIDDGPTRFAKPSTRIRLAADGSYSIASIGALDERSIRKALERNILFICSGNTCRSPMAAAIARSLVHDAAGMSTNVRSAGAFASDGEPITRESVEALKAIGINTQDAELHRSRELTRQMVSEADAIYTMTAAHAREVRRLDPTAADRIHTLDPEGDVADPIGGSQDVYTRTARRLKDLIEKRLAELGP